MRSLRHKHGVQNGSAEERARPAGSLYNDDECCCPCHVCLYSFPSHHKPPSPDCSRGFTPLQCEARMEEEGKWRRRRRRMWIDASRGLFLMACAWSLLMASAQLDEIPYIQGSWLIKYKFVEMKGDKNFRNACNGPFPYTYSWTFEFCQAPRKPQYTAVVAGADASSMRNKVLQSATPDVIILNCQYRATTLGPAGETQNWKKTNAPGYPEDSDWQSAKPRNEYNRQVEPRTFATYQLPLKPPYVWGSICNQYDWQDTLKMGAGFSFYKNAWRHENETWVFLRDPRYCSSKAGSQSQLETAVLTEDKGGCLETVEGTDIQRAISDECLQGLGINIDYCPYRLEGVAGGTVVFDEALTGVPKTPEGKSNYCFMYSRVSGTQLKAAKDVQANCGFGTKKTEDGAADATTTRRNKGFTPAVGFKRSSGSRAGISFSLLFLSLLSVRIFS